MYCTHIEKKKQMKRRRKKHGETCQRRFLKWEECLNWVPMLTDVIDFDFEFNQAIAIAKEEEEEEKNHTNKNTTPKEFNSFADKWQNNGL